MRTLITLLLTAVLALAIVGCAKAHKITYTDGRTITVREKPDFDKKTGFYEYEDVTGKKVQVNKDEIEKIEPVR